MLVGHKHYYLSKVRVQEWRYMPMMELTFRFTKCITGFRKEEMLVLRYL